MGRDVPLEKQITTNLGMVAADPQFSAAQVWLTFYLAGEPSRLRELADKLSADGWCDTDGWEGAFLYPKIEADRSAAPIIELAKGVIALCADLGVEVTNIDADTSADVASSKFITLYRA